MSIDVTPKEEVARDLLTAVLQHAFLLSPAELVIKREILWHDLKFGLISMVDRAVRIFDDRNVQFKRIRLEHKDTHPLTAILCKIANLTKSAADAKEEITEDEFIKEYREHIPLMLDVIKAMGDALIETICGK